MTLRGIIVFSAFIVAAYFAGLLYLAHDLLHPWRMPLQEYQKDWLQNPALHGITITPYNCDSGRIPCLMVAPDIHSGIGTRGTLLRTELEASGSQLNSFGTTQGILVLLHGRHGRKENLLAVAERFAAVGFNCVIPDLPAHGDNPADTSRFSLGKSEENIAANVLDDARRVFHDYKSPAGLWGLSMGGAYAAHAAAKFPDLWQTIVIVSSFDSLVGVIEDKLADYSIPFPKAAKPILLTYIRLLGNIDYNEVMPAHWSQTVRIPALVVHGDQDKLITFSRGKNLFDSFKNSPQKQWLTIDGAGHNDILITKAPLYAVMSRWFLSHCKKDKK